eukprot:TRINITY_DN938_c0_g2_i13.p1 TRINITY_DN938_c0_g2~~TRINITY_DN938_c0_g2_i13.p1  ORF type:complete len:216 (+),score=45.45 TRINITY_DN938_c0_g2_i13:344-991(+)
MVRCGAVVAAAWFVACAAGALPWATLTAYDTDDSTCRGEPWHVSATPQKCAPSACAQYRTSYGTFYAKTECVSEPTWPQDDGVLEQLFRNDSCAGTPAEFRWYAEGCKYIFKAECKSKSSVKLYDCFDDVGKCGTCDLVVDEEHGKCVRDLSSLYATLTCIGYKDKDKGLSSGAVAAIVIFTLLGVALLVGVAGFGVWYIRKNKPHWLYQALPTR